MADVVRLQSSHSLRFPSSSPPPPPPPPPPPSSSSLLVVNSLASNLKDSLPVSRICLHERVYPVVCSTARVVSRLPFAPRKQSLSFKLHAAVAETDLPKWWEKNAPNMIDIHSTEKFLSALSQAGDRLVIVEFYGTWCASCRALFPKLCRTAEDHPEILFLKVNFDETKPMCKSLNVKVLPYFHFYRGADGQLESFSCSVAKFQKIKDAIELHNTARCSIGPPKGVGELTLDSIAVPKDKSPGSTQT